MRSKLILAVSSVVLSIGAMGTAHAQDAPGTIVEVASANPDFSTLVTAVKAAGLVETLSGKGPFTVFAPTDEAFKKLPAGTLDKLLADPKGDLAKILTLHVIAGEVDAKAATAAVGTNVTTLGGPVAVAKDGDKLTFGGATITSTDIKASNGIIHVIDAVVTAPAEASADGATDTAAADTAAADTAAADAVETAAADTEAAVPSGVATGDDGLAASSGGTSGTLLFLLAGAAVLGIGASSTVLVKARRKN